MVRGVIVVSLLLLGVIYTQLNSSEHKERTEIKDEAFEYSEALNLYFTFYSHMKHRMMIICAAQLDLINLVQAYRFVFYDRSWRFMVAIFMLYGLRALILNLHHMPYPQGYIWEYPGFPSLFVPYGKTADFFFSGHVANCALNAVEFWEEKWFKLSIYSILVMIQQVLMMIFLRSHYSIDMVSGAIFAHYIWIMADRLVPK